MENGEAVEMEVAMNEVEVSNFASIRVLCVCRNQQDEVGISMYNNMCRYIEVEKYPNSVNGNTQGSKL